MANENDIFDAISTMAIMAMSSEPNKHAIIGTVSSGILTFTNDDGTTTQYVSVKPLDTSLTEIGCVRLGVDDTVKPTQTPVQGSIVSVIVEGDDSGYLSQIGQVSQVNLAISNTGQDYGGLIIIQDLVDKLNNLENKVNNLIAFISALVGYYNGHTHIASSFGSPTTVPSIIDNDTQPTDLQLTQVSDIENPVVKHGNGSQQNLAYQTQLSVALDAIEAQQGIVDGMAEQLPQPIDTASGAYISYQKAQVILEQRKAVYQKLVANPPQQ